MNYRLAECYSVCNGRGAVVSVAAAIALVAIARAVNGANGTCIKARSRESHCVSSDASKTLTTRPRRDRDREVEAQTFVHAELVLTVRSTKSFPSTEQ